MSDYSFNQKYHLQTVAEGKERYNRDGSVTTAMVKGLPVGDKIYNVPFYNRDTGKIMSEAEATQKWLPLISSGEIEGFDLKFDGDIYDHPANVQARKEHEMMDEYANTLKNKERTGTDYRDYRNKVRSGR